MNLPLLDMPEEPTALAGWLERQIVGLELADLAAELSAVYQSENGLATLDQILGTDKSRILTDGLSAAPLATLRQLLRHPHLLLELQEQILIEGGPHWQSVAISDEHRRAVAAQGKLLGEMLKPAETVPLRRTVAWGQKRWWALAAAASLLVAFLVWRQTASGPTWGWAKPDSVVAQAETKHFTAQQYLKQLAAEAGQWHNVKPTTRDGLEKRLREMRAGCDAVLASSHPPLPPAERDWLRGRCKLWASKFDDQLAELKQGADPETVRKQADETVDRLIHAIDAEAAKLG